MRRTIQKGVKQTKMLLFEGSRTHLVENIKFSKCA